MNNPFSFLRNRAISYPGQFCFECNICGNKNILELYQIQREAGICFKCGSNVRFRALMAILSTILYN